MVQKFTDENFNAEAKEQKLPVLVDFYADWCGPCRMMAPVVEKMAEKYEGKLVVGKLNVDENPEQTQAFKVRSIPYLVLLKDGAVADSMLGAGSARELESMICKVIGD